VAQQNADTWEEEGFFCRVNPLSLPVLLSYLPLLPMLLLLSSGLTKEDWERNKGVIM